MFLSVAVVENTLTDFLLSPIQISAGIFLFSNFLFFFSFSHYLHQGLPDKILDIQLNLNFRQTTIIFQQKYVHTVFFPPKSDNSTSISQCMISFFGLIQGFLGINFYVGNILVIFQKERSYLCQMRKFLQSVLVLSNVNSRPLSSPRTAGGRVQVRGHMGTKSLCLKPRR